MKHDIHITNRAILSRRGTTFDGGETVYHERAAWQCPLCQTWQEYETLTLSLPDKPEQEHCHRGCASSDQYFNGHHIAHCSSMACCAKANDMMKEPSP